MGLRIYLIGRTAHMFQSKYLKNQEEYDKAVKIFFDNLKSSLKRVNRNKIFGAKALQIVEKNTLIIYVSSSVASLTI